MFVLMRLHRDIMSPSNEPASDVIFLKKVTFKLLIHLAIPVTESCFPNCCCLLLCHVTVTLLHKRADRLSSLFGFP